MTPPTEAVAVVTGGSGTIGRAIAQALAAAGASVVVGYHHDRAGAGAVADEIQRNGGRASAVPVDVTVRESVEQLVEGCLARHGHLDILVNNAGVMRRRGFLELSDDDWDVTLAVNLKGYFLCGQIAARAMVRRGQGVIVNVSSTNDTIATPDTGAYAASKGAVRMLTRQMALELAPFGIRANAVAPGMVESDFNRENLADAAFHAAALARIPIGRLRLAEDVAKAVCFLASADAAFITGTTLRVDGGRVVA